MVQVRPGQDAPPPPCQIGYLPEGLHWLAKSSTQGRFRTLSSTRSPGPSGFSLYDAELVLPVPLKLRGGPDEYTIQNLTSFKLLDVAVIAPTEAEFSGSRGLAIRWHEALSPPLRKGAWESRQARRQKGREEEAERKKKPTSEKATEVFTKAENEAKGDKTKDELKPLPAEGDADVRARVDQILNRPVNVNAEQVPRKDVLNQVASQARFRYDLDDKAIAKDNVDLGKPMTLKAPRIAARDALADVLGTVGLSYRVTEDGSLYITTAARLAEDSNKQGAAIEGPPIKLTLSLPFKRDNPSYRELTRDSYARRLARQGLREEVLNALLDQYADAMFAPEGLIVLAHYSRDAIDEAALLDVFPAPRKLVRTAVLVIHGIDPRLQDKARELVAKLGDNAPKTREDAESKLYELGSVAVPVLEDALRNKDLEIVFRAERLLLKMNRQVP